MKKRLAIIGTGISGMACGYFLHKHFDVQLFKQDKGTQLPHILNGSGVALARLFVSLIETHQQGDGSINIPEPLRDYLKADQIAS